MLGLRKIINQSRVKTACAIERTGELQPDANVILKKGVLGEAWRA